MGKGQLTKDFTLRMLDAEKMEFEGGYVLEGTPKDATPAYQKMLLYVDGADLPGPPRADPRRAGQPQPLRLQRAGREPARAGERVHLHAAARHQES